MVTPDPTSYAVLDEQDRIVNAVLWDGASDYSPGDGLTLQLLDQALAAGCTYPAADEPADLVQQPVTVDPDVLAGLVAQAAGATTVAKTAAVLRGLLDALGSTT